MTPDSRPVVYPLRDYRQREMLHGVAEEDAAAALRVVAEGKADQLESSGEEWIARVGTTVYAAIRSKRHGQLVLHGWPNGHGGQDPETKYAAIIEGWRIGGFYF